MNSRQTWNWRRLVKENSESYRTDDVSLRKITTNMGLLPVVNHSERMDWGIGAVEIGLSDVARSAALKTGKMLFFLLRMIGPLPAVIQPDAGQAGGNKLLEICIYSTRLLASLDAFCVPRSPINTMSSTKAQLETLLANPRLGPESHPELFRLLRENVLVFLMPYHPEIMGKFSLKNGDPLPKFSLWKDGNAIRVPIFSSIERANEACKTIRVKDGTFAFAELKGEQLFHLLSCQPNEVMINPGCKSGTLYFDKNAIKMLADGSILEPVPPGNEKSGQVQIVEPADYPTDFLQPLFRFLRERKEIKAAWLFREAELTPEGQVSFVFILRSEGDSQKTIKDFNIVAKSACPRTATFGVTSWDPNNAPLVAVTAKHPGFYSAPDYKGPSLM